MRVQVDGVLSPRNVLLVTMLNDSDPPEKGNYVPPLNPFKSI